MLVQIDGCAGNSIINSGNQIRSSVELERESPKSGLNRSANFRLPSKENKKSSEKLTPSHGFYPRKRKKKV